MAMNDAPNINELQVGLLLIYFFNTDIPIRFPAPVAQQSCREPLGHKSVGLQYKQYMWHGMATWHPVNSQAAPSVME